MFRLEITLDEVISACDSFMGSLGGFSNILETRRDFLKKVWVSLVWLNRFLALVTNYW